MTALERPRAVVVDKDEHTGKEMAQFLAAELGCNVTRVRDGEAAFNVLDDEVIHVLVTDLAAQRIDGMRLMEIARARNPESAVIIIAPNAELAPATEAMRSGAYDVQTHPINFDRLSAVLERWDSLERLPENENLSHTDINALFDSELERLFIEVLGNTRGCALATQHINGKPGYVIAVKHASTGRITRWSIEPQVDLDAASGVVVASRPDFFMRCLSEGADVRPMAVFLDGFEHHADIADDDTRKRMLTVLGEDAAILNYLKPAQVPPLLSDELLLANDKHGLEFRKWVKQQEAAGKAIDTQAWNAETERIKALPSPGRRSDPKSWVLGTVPLKEPVPTHDAAE